MDMNEILENVNTYGVLPLYNQADNESGIISTSESRYDSDIFLEDYSLRVNKYLYGDNKNQ